VGYLHTHLLHNNIERLDEFWQKQARYALAEARMLYQAGRRTRLRNFIGAPAREFWRRYVRLGGWRDGALGLFLCGSLAWFEVVKFGMLTLLSVSTQHAPYR
ncbi:MAG: glycosyltransferase family 2 protein, partial [Chloroflexaceae bacterium]|nr:glycosyltransferase family 2 protein [Chloroflexaceae bacterium]